MKYLMILTVGVCLIVSTAMVAQETPKPAPELKKLDPQAGNWTWEGEMKPGPMGPGGKFTSKDTCEWFEGGFALICRSEGQGPTGPTKSMGILSFDSSKSVYTYYGVENMSPPGGAEGTVDGDTWTWHWDANVDGKAMKGRFTLKMPSPTSQTTKAEYSVDGGPWTTMMEAKGTKEGH